MAVSKNHAVSTSSSVLFLFWAFSIFSFQTDFFSFLYSLCYHLFFHPSFIFLSCRFLALPYKILRHFLLTFFSILLPYMLYMFECNPKNRSCSHSKIKIYFFFIFPSFPFPSSFKIFAFSEDFSQVSPFALNHSYLHFFTLVLFFFYFFY